VPEVTGNVERFQSARTYLAQVYADTAAKLAQAAKDDPGADLRTKYKACRTAWNALVDIENALRASVLAGDPIDDFHRGGAAAVGHERSYAEKVNAPLSPEVIEALRRELASGNPARYRKAR
jgi:hypothetical protein